VEGADGHELVEQTRSREHGGSSDLVLTADPCSAIAAVICACMGNDEASAGREDPTSDMELCASSMGLARRIPTRFQFFPLVLRHSGASPSFAGPCAWARCYRCPVLCCYG
jgi:hypothetical protein